MNEFLTKLLVAVFTISLMAVIAAIAVAAVVGAARFIAG
jgi:hypothetical protein